MLGGASQRIGQRVGHIRLVSVIGEGGMGAVFKGEDETLQRQVAVKAIRPECRLDQQARARFLREARLLSQMDHPGICTVFDYVEGDDGDFLVMELVPGRNLRGAIHARLSVAEQRSVASQLFQILAAVHERGVIHRDLKPENIMVASDGRIKVLDFGLSRSADQVAAGARTPELGDGEDSEPETPEPVDDGPIADLAVHASQLPTRGSEGGDRVVESESGSGSIRVYTAHGTVLGTAGYMSPEQARGEPASPASDMYALGLVLQELFTGKLPFEAGLSTAELLERARRAESVPVAGLPADLTALIERLKRAEPGARPSALDAAELYRRILDRPRRLRRRALVATVWVVLVALTAGMTVQSIRADAARRRSEQEAATTARVSDFLKSLFEVSDPARSLGDPVTARELLDRGVARIGEELADEPLIRAQLEATMGDVYVSLGEHAPAEDLFLSALELRRRELGPEHADVAASLSDLGTYYRVSGRLAEAETTLRQSLELQARHLGSDHPDLGETHYHLGVLHKQLGRLADAEAELERALELWRDTLPPEDREVLECRSSLAALYRHQGRFDEALALARDVVEIRQEHLPAGHPDLATSRLVLANICLNAGRRAESESLFRNALPDLEKAYGNSHPVIGVVQGNLAQLCLLDGRLAEAEALQRQALELYERTLDPGHVAVADAVDRLGQILLARGQAAAAEPLIRRGLEIRLAQLGEDHPHVRESRNNLARARQTLDE
jgi:serine/threonine-protein kinase